MTFFFVLVLVGLSVFGFAGVVLCGLELTSLAGTMDYHVHVFRLGTLGFGQGDGEYSLGHFLSPLSYEVLYLVSLKSIYALSQKMSSIILRKYKIFFNFLLDN